MHVALREGDDDPGFLEAAVDFQVQCGLHRPHVIDVVDIETADHVQGVVAKITENNGRSRVSQNPLVIGDRFSEDLERQRGVAAVGNTHRQCQSQPGIGQRPVKQAPGDDFLVGYYQFLVVPVAYGRRPNTNPGDDAILVTHRNNVTDTDRPFEQDDQATNEVGNYFL